MRQSCEGWGTRRSSSTALPAADPHVVLVEPADRGVAAMPPCGCSATNRVFRSSAPASTRQPSDMAHVLQATTHLLKPFSLVELTDALQLALSQSDPLSAVTKRVCTGRMECPPRAQVDSLANFQIHLRSDLSRRTSEAASPAAIPEGGGGRHPFGASDLRSRSLWRCHDSSGGCACDSCRLREIGWRLRWRLLPGRVSAVASAMRAGFESPASFAVRRR